MVIKIGKNKMKFRDRAAASRLVSPVNEIRHLKVHKTRQT